MAENTVDLDAVLNQDDLAKTIANLWNRWDMARGQHRAEILELRNYLFATDTSTTTAGENPWQNNTTMPKLTQIRDNLETNYLASLFPNRNWMQWESDNKEDAVKTKVQAIESFMRTKTRMRGSQFRPSIGKAVLDYIDEGNTFMTAEFVREMRILRDGTETPKYIGPKFIRIAPQDIVFDPKAASFPEAPKIVRAIISMSDLALRAKDNPEMRAAFEMAMAKRTRLASGPYQREDWEKFQAYAIDGFGSLQEYYSGDLVEVLTLYGSVMENDTLLPSHKIVIIDRQHVVSKEPLPNWMGHGGIFKAGWRDRQSNLWSMGPLANLVGMQYRIDHLQNLKSDALDLAVDPPIGVKGDVDAFIFQPGERIELGENGDLVELGKNLSGVFAADQEIEMLENRMELYSGAPREAMGVRSPGEKTAFEVGELVTAASRTFRIKTEKFAEELLAPLLEFALELTVRNSTREDIFPVTVSTPVGTVFQDLKRENLQLSGQYRIAGIAHFGDQAQLIQNLVQLSNTSLWPEIRAHWDKLGLAGVLEQALNLEEHNLVEPMAGIREDAEIQSQINAESDRLAGEDILDDDDEI